MSGGPGIGLANTAMASAWASGPLQTPDAFGMIEVGLYRSGPIHPVHFPFINGLGLRTVLVLSVDGMPTRAASTFLEESGVDVVPLAQSSSAVTHSRGGMQDVGNGVGRNGHGQLCLRPLEERVKLALELMLDRRNHPLLITCTNGMQETGVVTACLRKLLGWNLTAIFAEYRNFAGSKSRMVHEQAVELFDLDLVTVPRAQHLPGWFVDYQRMLKEDEDDSEAQHRASYSLATKCEISVDEEMSGTVEQRATL